MSRILHHVGRNDFKKTRQRQIGEQKERAAHKLKEWQEAEVERKQIEEAARRYKSNWRDELVVPVPEEVVVEVQEPKVNKILKVNREKGGVVSDEFIERVVSEGMTSSGMFQTTLPADNNLGGITANDYSLIAGASVDGSSAVLDSNNLPGSFGNAQVFTSFLDLSNIDTLQFNISKRSVGSSEELRLFWRTPDMVSGGDANFYLLKNTFFSSQTVDVKNSIAQYTDPSQIQFAIKSFYAGSTTPRNYTTWNINSATFQRRTPINVFVSLDSPEATAFIRTDPIMRGLSAAQREKKLLEMLEAGDEYLLKQLGMTGSSARPEATKDPVSWEQAQLSPRTEKQIDDMLLKGLMRGDYGSGPDIERQIRNLKRNQQNNTPGGMQVQGNKETQIAQIPPGMKAPHSNIKYDKQMKQYVPDNTNADQILLDKLKKAKKQNTNNYVVAHHEPQGEVLSEKRKLKKVKDISKKIPGYYDGKPSPVGFPMDEPPKMINGFHPDLIDGKKVADRFNKMDPISARSMPATGNPHIDKRVKAAAKKRR